MNRTSVWTALVAIPLSLFPIPHLSAQKRAITFDDLIALKTVNDPQLSPDGKWVAYAVTTNSLQDNRGVARIWLAEVATGQSRQVTQGPGSDRSPRWSPDGQTLAFLSTRQNGSQIW
ncbi:MAG: S9 family peptidase, partial [Bacillati bacterium ANGP1]